MTYNCTIYFNEHILVDPTVHLFEVHTLSQKNNRNKILYLDWLQRISGSFNDMNRVSNLLTADFFKYNSNEDGGLYSNIEYDSLDIGDTIDIVPICSNEEANFECRVKSIKYSRI